MRLRIVLTPRTALSRTGRASSAAPVLALKVLSSLRSGLSGLRFAIQILHLAGLTRVLARASSPLASARLSAPLRTIGSARGSLSALCSLTSRLSARSGSGLLCASIRLRGCRLSAGLPACGGRLCVLSTLILRAGSLCLRVGLRAR